MYNPSSQPPPPQQQQARKPNPALHATANELQAKEKLMQYVYEYLVHMNAPKTAEAFKAELLSNQAVQIQEPPGFLSTWFCIFWDLYSAEPDRRDKCNPTQEAKAFHDMGFVNNTPGMRPNFMGGPPQPMGMPSSEGMMSPYFRGMAPYGSQRPTPPSYGPSSQLMYPPPTEMRNMNPNRMRMPTNFPMRPPRYGGPYMDSPTGNPGYSQFMPPDQMQPPSSMTPSTSVPTSMSMNGQIPMSEGGQQQPLPPLSANNPLTGIMNGEEIKHSPSHHIGSVHGQNGGTPLGPGSQHGNMAGPGSAAPGAPASVQSQSGQPGSVVNPTTSSSQQPSQTSMVALNQAQPNFGDPNIMDFQNELANNNPNSHENLEIKKIREGLLDDYPNET